LVRHRAAFTAVALSAVVSLSLGGSSARATAPRRAVRGVSPGGTRAGRVTADFNGDGFADVAVSALYASAPGAAQAGGVDVIYGGPAGLQSTSPAPQWWTSASPGMPTAAQAGEQFGWSLASGDYNADGSTDLAIGVPRFDVNGKTDPGGVIVLYGGAQGLQTASPPAQVFTGDTPGMPSPAQAGALFSRYLISGDFNGDGVADLAIGAPRAAVASLSEAGEVYVLSGVGGVGLQASNPAAQLWTQNSPGMPMPAAAGAWFGRSLAAGDVNGDGYADLAVGAPLESVVYQTRTVQQAGVVFVLYGGSNGLQGADPPIQSWSKGAPGLRGGRPQKSEYFGHNLAIGDFNDDGYADLASGNRHSSVGTYSNTGSVSVLYGGSKGLQTDNPANQYWSLSSSGMPAAPESGTQFGFFVVGADFNGDSYADLAVGAPFYDLPSLGDSGGAVILYGGPAGLQTASPPAQFWNQTSPHIQGTPQVGALFGSNLDANDYNGDGTADISIGVIKEDLPGPIVDAGATNVLYGVPGGGIQTDSPPNQVWNESSPGIPNPPVAGDEFGWWLA